MTEQELVKELAIAARQACQSGMPGLIMRRYGLAFEQAVSLARVVGMSWKLLSFEAEDRERAGLSPWAGPREIVEGLGPGDLARVAQIGPGAEVAYKELLLELIAFKERGGGDRASSANRRMQSY